jgi:signal transduction histidine kinase
MLSRWQRALYLPLRAGKTVVAVLALGQKQYGESYSLADLQQLQQLGAQVGPALALMGHVTRLQQIQAHIFRMNQSLAQERQHLQALTDLYADFVEKLAPELTRPFHPLNEALSQLQENLSNGDGRSQLETIRQELEHLQTPLDKVINTAGQIQQRRRFSFAPVQIEDVARAAQRQLRHMADARNVRIEFQATGPIPTIVGDEEQLAEAVHHVLHNAIKYNKIGGVIHVHCGTAGNEAYIRIDDTGVGIPEKRLDDVWRTFPNLLSKENGRQRRPHLGLTLTQFIVDAHGGRLDVKSSYGAGSQFIIYLPVTLAET